MSRLLQIHPGSTCAAVERIEVSVARPSSESLVLTYLVTGDIGLIRMPDSKPPTRADNLWKHTCFEAFVLAPRELSYAELNLSPSTRWAAYWFDRYREGMRNLPQPLPPRIEARAEPGRYALSAIVDLADAPLARSAPWKLGLSAVIEELDGGLSYWALAHPSPQPDFHNANGFVYEVPAAETL